MLLSKYIIKLANETRVFLILVSQINELTKIAKTIVPSCGTLSAILNSPHSQKVRFVCSLEFINSFICSVANKFRREEVTRQE
jgi:hypothetical protein